MSDAGQNRISVLRDNQLVPLLPCGPNHSHERSEQPWRGLLLERHTVAPLEIPEHEHRELCLHLQLTGDDRMQWWSGGRHGVENTFPGSIMLVPAGTRDRALWHGSSERLILSLAPELIDEVAAGAQVAAGARVAAGKSAQASEFNVRWSLQDTSLQHLLFEMGREASEGWPLGRLYADLTATSLVSQLLRRHAADRVDFGPLRGGMPMPQLRRAIQFITDSLDRDLSLEEIAREVGLSAFHFAHEFRALTNQTPYQYLLDQRMDRAKHLLKNQAWTVQEIATMTGFRSPVNFVRTFRQRVGATPGAWRRYA